MLCFTMAAGETSPAASQRPYRHSAFVLGKVCTGPRRVPYITFQQVKLRSTYSTDYLITMLPRQVDLTTLSLLITVLEVVDWQLVPLLARRTLLVDVVEVPCCSVPPETYIYFG